VSIRVRPSAISAHAHEGNEKVHRGRLYAHGRMCAQHQWLVAFLHAFRNVTMYALQEMRCARARHRAGAGRQCKDCRLFVTAVRGGSRKSGTIRCFRKEVSDMTKSLQDKGLVTGEGRGTSGRRRFARWARRKAAKGRGQRSGGAADRCGLERFAAEE